MPKKTIYISEEDLAVFEKAKEKFSGESFSKLIVDALRSRLIDREELREKAFVAELLSRTGIPILVDLTELYLQTLPEDIVSKARERGALVESTEEGREIIYHGWAQALWEGSWDNSEFQKAKRLEHAEVSWKENLENLDPLLVDAWSIAYERYRQEKSLEPPTANELFEDLAKHEDFLKLIGLELKKLQSEKKQENTEEEDQ